MSDKKLIYLADLTHTGVSIASNVFPLAVGLIASYLEVSLPGEYEVELFKYPDDFNRALKRRIPDIVGFSNYSWNCDISMQYARQIREHSPQTIIVFGGPNYGLTPDEVHAFWSRYSWIDFYIVKEGERAFVELLKGLKTVGYDANALKQTPVVLPNCHFQSDQRLIQGPIGPRVTELSEIGSPYLKGLMDKFFDDVLVPMIHTTRGCPFSCTFCSEGNSYYNKVAQVRDVGYSLEQELRYIADRVKQIPDLLITDANFGMYQEDRQKAITIAKVQEEYGWPKHIIVSTGKNRKERIIEVANILNGTMSVAASLQSTDEQILKNIKRANISRDALNEIVAKTEKSDTTTYTELILGLPGDNVTSHISSLRDVVDAGLGIVRIYQLILLPQTELCENATRQKYGMQTKFRINPRGMGRYSFLDQSLVSVECEEICVSNNTLSWEDYLYCREIDLTVEIIHNSKMFPELLGMCKWLDHSWLDFILRVHSRVRRDGRSMTSLYDTFRKDSSKGLWDSQDELERHVRENIDMYLNDTEGTNEMSKGKASAVFLYNRELHDVLYDEMIALITEAGRWDSTIEVYLREMKEISLARKSEFLDTDKPLDVVSHFDIQQLEKVHYLGYPGAYFHSEPRALHFYHTEDQKELIGSYVNQYGKTSLDQKGRILMRAHAHVSRLFRSVEVA